MSAGLQQQQQQWRQDQRQIESLLRLAGFDESFRLVEELTEGYSNRVYKVEEEATGKTFAAKIYSDSAKVRCPPDERGLWDESAGLAALGPTVYARTPDSLLTEFLSGRTARAEDLRKDLRALAFRVAPRLAALHALPTDNGEEEVVLTRGMSALLDCAEKCDDKIGVFGNRIAAEAREVLEFVTKTQKPDAMIHGDLKSSNIMLCEDDRILFLDFEVAGPGYAAYDVAKLFRDNLDRPAQRPFLQTYLEAGGHDASPAALDYHLRSVAFFEPLAWLEAAVFFVYMASTTEKGTPNFERWLSLAQSRWKSYEVARDRARTHNLSHNSR